MFADTSMLLQLLSACLCLHAVLGAAPCVDKCVVLFAVLRLISLVTCTNKCFPLPVGLCAIAARLRKASSLAATNCSTTNARPFVSSVSIARALSSWYVRVFMSVKVCLCDCEYKSYRARSVSPTTSSTDRWTSRRCARS